LLRYHHLLHSFPTRRSSDLASFSAPCTSITCRPSFGSTSGGKSTRSSPSTRTLTSTGETCSKSSRSSLCSPCSLAVLSLRTWPRSEEHTSELQSRENLVCRL